MCGRFALKISTPELARMFGIPLEAIPPDVAALASVGPGGTGNEAAIERYNIAPSQPVVVCARGPGGTPRLGTMRWGLVPRWAKDERIGYRMINARAETAAERPAFRDALRRRRCLIPASGFYEWQERPGGKQPFYVRLGSGAPFAFAGLWARWPGTGDPAAPLLSCAILTTEPNARLADIHDRMPVILPREHHAVWLDAAVEDPGALQALLRPYDAAPMEAYPVSTHVNRPRHDDPRCLEPAGAAAGATRA